MPDLLKNSEQDDSCDLKFCFSEQKLSYHAALCQSNPASACAPDSGADSSFLSSALQFFMPMTMFDQNND
jgi:hypothetical protein